MAERKRLRVFAPGGIIEDGEPLYTLEEAAEFLGVTVSEVEAALAQAEEENPEDIVHLEEVPPS